MTFKRILAESGLSKIELGILYGVSKQTIHFWINRGHTATPEDSYVGRMAASITGALTIALDKKALPLRAMDREARRARIKKMAAQLQGMKPTNPTA